MGHDEYWAVETLKPHLCHLASHRHESRPSSICPEFVARSYMNEELKLVATAVIPVRGRLSGYNPIRSRGQKEAN